MSRYSVFVQVEIDVDNAISTEDAEKQALALLSKGHYAIREVDVNEDDVNE